ncbi:hypothetical protein PCANC_15256 [Puccinia coronata f. sp. avenae]|uniref:Uncharacterized protein n=1 Tax=Puccinia coronata f. sp. avenae TaxID=200324 RepID=A0A2N5UIH5_9BASI|nr:hypothetical protein PCANC_15256 [Puccinia coronata f. sp. avenae]
MAIELHNSMEVPAVDLHGSMAGLGHGSVNTSVTGCVGVDTPMTGHGHGGVGTSMTGHGGVDTSMSTHLLTESSWRAGTTCLPWAPGELVSTDLLVKSPWRAGTDHLTDSPGQAGLDLLAKTSGEQVQTCPPEPLASRFAPARQDLR